MYPVSLFSTPAAIPQRRTAITQPTFGNAEILLPAPTAETEAQVPDELQNILKGYVSDPKVPGTEMTINQAIERLRAREFGSRIRRAQQSRHLEQATLLSVKVLSKFPLDNLLGIGHLSGTKRLNDGKYLHIIDARGPSDDSVASVWQAPNGHYLLLLERKNPIGT